MPSNTTAHDEPGDRIPRWAATAGHQTLAKRLTAKIARLFRRTRQPRSRTHPDGDATQPRRTEHYVLRAYHANNLARARRASEQLVREGWNIGPIPYGYRPHRVRIAGHTRRPRHRTRLLIEPVDAATVAMIYRWRVHERLSPQAIVVRLTDNHYPQPRDPITGQAQPWTVDRVTTILHNPSTPADKCGDAAKATAARRLPCGCGPRRKPTLGSSTT
jgi:hypothetical protein